MKKSTPHSMPAGAMPVRPVPTISARDPNFYEDGSGEAAREEPLVPLDEDIERGLPAPMATTGGMPFALDEKLSSGGGRR